MSTQNAKPYRATYSLFSNRVYLWCPPKKEGGLSAEDLKLIGDTNLSWWPRGCYTGLWNPSVEDLIIDHFDLDIEPDDQPDNLIQRVERYTKYADNDERDAVNAKERLTSGRANTVRRIHMTENVLVRKSEEAAYWNSRIAGAIRHAEYMDKPDVIARRVKGYMADRRKHEKWLAKPTFKTTTPQSDGEFHYYFGNGVSGGWVRESAIAGNQAYHQRWLDHYDRLIKFYTDYLESQGGDKADLEPAPRRKSVAPKDGIEKGVKVSYTKWHYGKTWELTGRVLRAYPHTLHVSFPEGEYFERAKASDEHWCKNWPGHEGDPFPPKHIEVFRRNAKVTK